MEIDIKGHSGCSVDVVRDGKQLFIYKTTRDKNYLSRLRLQGEKQIKAQEFLINNIKVPKIYDIESNESITQLKMEYVYSKNYVEYFEHAGFEQIDSFTNGIIRFIESEIASSELMNIPSNVLIDKFYDVKEKISRSLPNDVEVVSLLNKSEMIFSKERDSQLPVGVCHGDLTFSNILFNGNDCYLIDFLDSFVESPLLDIVKIRQDSAYMWSRLMYKHPVDDVRLNIICKRIDCTVETYFSKYLWYTNNYKQYQLMNMLRILQYAKAENVVSYLKRIIGGLVDEF